LDFGVPDNSNILSLENDSGSSDDFEIGIAWAGSRTKLENSFNYPQN